MEPGNRSHATGIALGDLARRCGAELAGDGELMIYRVATLEDADARLISFLSNARYRAQLATTRAGAVIVAPRDAQATPLPKLVTGILCGLRPRGVDFPSASHGRGRYPSHGHHCRHCQGCSERDDRSQRGHRLSGVAIR